MLAEPAIPDFHLAALRAHFLATGARPTDTAILQPLSLMLDLAGEALRSRLFIVQAEGGRRPVCALTSRPPSPRRTYEFGGGWNLPR